MSETDPHYQEVLNDSERLESNGHTTVKGMPYNFIKDYRDDKTEYHPNMFFPTYKLLFDGSDLYTPDALEKAENVQELAEAQRELDVNHPALIYQDGTYSEYEFIPGATLEEELEGNPSDIEDISRQIGEMTEILHDADFARYDNRVGNVIVDRSGIIEDEPLPFFIDSEYVVTDAQKGDKNLDLVSFIDSINNQNPEVFNDIFEGFSDGYGKVPISSIALAGLRTVAEKTLEKEFDQSTNALENTLRAFYFNIRNNSI